MLSQFWSTPTPGTLGSRLEILVLRDEHLRVMNRPLEIPKVSVTGVYLANAF